MKLLYFTIQINMVGGLAKIVIDKINWLTEQGYDITLCNIESSNICPAYPLDSRVERISANIQATPGGMLTRGKGVLAAIKRTKEIIAQVQPDIIINAHCPLVTWILPFVHKDIPKIIEMHQSRQGLEVFNRQFLSPLARFVHRHATKWIYGRYERFVVLTHGDRDSWGCKNCIVIPNFHNFEVLADVPERAEYKQIIMLARLMPQKRIDLMIDVWAKLADDFPDWHVKVLGEGFLRQELERKIHSLGLDTVFLLPGEVNDVTKELQSSDLLCLTPTYSKAMAGMPFAMASINTIPKPSYSLVRQSTSDDCSSFVTSFTSPGRRKTVSRPKLWILRSNSWRNNPSPSTLTCQSGKSSASFAHTSIIKSIRFWGISLASIIICLYSACSGTSVKTVKLWKLGITIQFLHPQESLSPCVSTTNRL